MDDQLKWEREHNIYREDYGTNQPNTADQLLQERTDLYFRDLARSRNADDKARREELEARKTKEFYDWWNNLTPQQQAEYRERKERERIREEDEKARYRYEREEERLQEYRERQEQQERDRRRDEDDKTRTQYIIREAREKEAKERQERQEAQERDKINLQAGLTQTKKEENLKNVKPIILEEIGKLDFNVRPNPEAADRLAPYYRDGVEKSQFAFKDGSFAFKDDVIENIKYLDNEELKKFIEVQVELIKTNYENKITDEEIMNDRSLSAQRYYDQQDAERFQKELCTLVTPILYRNIESKRRIPNKEPIEAILDTVEVSALKGEPMGLDVLDSIIISNELYPYTYAHPKTKATAETTLSNYERSIALTNARKAYDDLSPLKKFVNRKLMEKIETLETSQQIEAEAQGFSR